MTMPPLRLPEGWSVEEEVLDRIDVGGAWLHRAGIAVRAPSGEIVTGSAAGLEDDVAPRARFELLERVATCEAIARGEEHPLRDLSGASRGHVSVEQLFVAAVEGAAHRPARSNGVALHQSWTSAALAAHRELVERDHVLRAWYGRERPERVAIAPGWALGSLPTYEWRAYSFGLAHEEAWCAGVRVHGVFGVPRDERMPFVIGWGAGSDDATSLARAHAEATQALAFLWGETVPAAEPTPAPNAGAHLERTLWPEHRAALLAWLAGDHTRYAASRDTEQTRRAEPADVRFADLTPAWLEPGLHVAHASHPDAVSLWFGDAPAAGHLPPALRFHPIA